MADALAAKFATLAYLLHFIDFEAAAPALPFHAGLRSYEQLFHQFSHHCLTHDGQIAHVTQHLDSRPGAFPNFDGVRALAEAIGTDGGSVIHWWSHEMARLYGTPVDAPPRPSMRRATASTADVVKSGFDERQQRSRHRLNVSERKYSGDEGDARYSRPSIKSASSVRQLAVSETIAGLIQAYVENYRGKPNHVFLLNRDRHGALGPRRARID